MAGALRSLFQIREGEGRQALVFGAYIALVVGNVIFLQTYNDASFLSAYDSKYLPYLFIASSLVMSIASIGFGILSDRVTEGRLCRYTPVAAAGVLLACRLISLAQLRGAIFIVYVVIFAVYGLMAIQGWNYTRGAFDTRQVKRLMPMFGVLSSVGAILGGLAARFLSKLIGTDNLLFFGAGLFVAAALLTIPGNRWVSEREEKPRKREGVLSSAREGFGLIARNRLMLLMTALLIGSVVVKTIIDYQFKTTLRARYDKAQMTAFLGNFFAAGNLVELLVQLFLSGRLMSRFGLPPALSSRPIVLGTLGMLGAFSPMFWVFASARFSEWVLNRTWYKAGTTLVFAPLPTRRANRIKLTQDGTIEPLVVIATSSLLIVCVRFLTPAQLCWIIVAAAAAWFLAVFRINALYLRELAHAIETRLFDFDQDVQIGQLMNDETLARLTSKLGSADPEDVRFALRVIGETGAARLAMPVKELLAHPAEDVRSAAAATLATLTPKTAAAPLRARLPAETSPRVAAQILRCLADVGDEQSVNLAHDILAGQSAVEVQIEALLLLFKLGGFDGILAAVQRFAALQAGGEVERQALAQIIGRLEVGHLDRTLVSLLRDPSVRTRRAALEAALHIRSAPLLEEVVRLLADPDLREPAEAALIAAGPMGASAAASIFDGGEPSPELKSSALRVLAANPRPDDLARVVEQLDGDEERVRSEALSALARFRAAGLAAPDAALRARFRAELTRAALMKAHLGKPDELLDREIGIRLQQSLRHLFLLLGLRHDPEDVSNAYRGTTGKDPRSRANAIEFLDATLTDPLEKLFLLLVETSNGVEAYEQVREGLELPPFDPNDRERLAQADPWIARILRADAALDGARRIGEAEMFRVFRIEVLCALAREARRSQHEAGAVLFEEGQEAPACFVVETGSIERQSADGRTQRVGGGGVCGDLAVMMSGVHQESARCAEATTVIAICAEDLQHLLRRDAGATRALTSFLLKSIREETDREAGLRRSIEEAGAA